MDVPQLIIDLAVMLTAAAVVTIIFRRLKIPAILGYILVGFLIGPYFPYFLDVSSEESLEILSEIGVVIILFHVGLEFDFNKLTEIGSTALVSAVVKMAGVMLVGFAFGLMLGMTTMDSIFLGTMLSISSTVVIQKCFDEMNLTGEKYTKLVLGSLVMEDVIAVFMMVVLTAINVSKNSSTTDLALHMFLMITYLILWLVLGIFLLPTFLDKAMAFMNSETLTLLSVGLCFSMAIIARALGFSGELGAFIAGSLFAGTRHVHAVENATSGIKDMFGAIFFLSVGMLVNPEIIVDRWTSIVPIAIIAVIAKLIFATIGMMLSGQDIDTALRGGISLAPIGEFSFIIAALGVYLGVIEEYLYPVIVASSVLTIMMTPILMRQSDTIVEKLKEIAPEGLKKKVKDYTSDERSEEEKSSEWGIVLKDYFSKILIYGSIMLVVALTGSQVLYPALDGLIGKTPSKIAVVILIYAVLAIFARPFMGRRSASFTNLWMDKLSNRPPLVVMVILKVVILEFIALIPLRYVLDISNPIILLLIPVSIFLIARSEFVLTYYLQLETRFFANLNQKTMEERGGERSHQHWMNEDYNIISWIVPKGARYIGRPIGELNWGKNDSIYIVKIRRGERRFAMPSSKMALQEGDKVHAIGEKHSLRLFIKNQGLEGDLHMRTLKEFFKEDYGHKEHALACAAIKVRGSENYVGKPIKKSGLSTRLNCMILGLERDGYATMMPDANMLIEKGDILWLVGTDTNLSRIAAHSLGEAGKHAEAGEAS